MSTGKLLVVLQEISFHCTVMENNFHFLKKSKLPTLYWFRITVIFCQMLQVGAESKMGSPHQVCLTDLLEQLPLLSCN